MHRQVVGGPVLDATDGLDSVFCAAGPKVIKASAGDFSHPNGQAVGENPVAKASVQSELGAVGPVFSQFGLGAGHDVGVKQDREWPGFKHGQQSCASAEAFFAMEGAFGAHRGRKVGPSAQAKTTGLERAKAHAERCIL